MESGQKLAAEICRREGLSPNQVYQCRKQLVASDNAAYESTRSAHEYRRIEQLSVEITAENLELKKTLSD